MTSLLKPAAMAAIALKAPEAALDRVVELRRRKRLLDVNCVLDVGANQGQFAEELRGVGFRGLIVSLQQIQEQNCLIRRDNA
jgi:hypothetical protein